MATVASRELRNETRAVLARVDAGEAIEITVAGRPVARLVPIDRRPQFMGRDEFLRRISGHQADAGLTSQLQELAPDTTDDLPLE